MFSPIASYTLRGIFAVALLCVIPAQAQSVVVKDAWIRGTVPGQSATGAFMELTAKSAARLIGAASAAAKNVEVHNMTMENGVMKMFPVDGVDIPAGKTIKFAPGGYHVMMRNLQKPLNPGDKVLLQLTFELANKKRETVALSVEVRDVTGQPAPHHRH
jgi:periplasmic copper chaperone A